MMNGVPPQTSPLQRDTRLQEDLQLLLPPVDLPPEARRLLLVAGHGPLHHRQDLLRDRDVQPLLVMKEVIPPEWSPSLDQEDQEPLRIKEDQEDQEPLRIKEEKDQEPRRIKEDQEDQEPLRIKEDQEDQEPLRIKEEKKDQEPLY
ncbi:uncharacterized protein PEZ65_011983 [Lycodopsis pacificus]